MGRRPMYSPQRKLVFGTMPVSLWAAIILVTLPLHMCVAHGPLQVGHYAFSCPSAESIVRRAMERSMQQDRSIVAGVLRLHFHDCFVEGCDGSVLLDGPGSEKTASPNLSLRGFEVVDAAKADLEAQCPGVVSCADILAFAARDAVELSGGLGWPVRAGRLDGRVSIAAQADADIPDPSNTVSQNAEVFARKGLSKSDMIVLSGAHTIGHAHCDSVASRLYPVPEPGLSEELAARLMASCPPQGSSATMNLDSTTPARFDNNYYTNIINHRGLLHSDQALFTDISTRGEVIFNSLLAAPWTFQFSRVMIQMGNIQVKTGQSEGEIRRNCRFIN
ncbi:hypothetical protein KC19_4G144200 [Ceratodon purpureus]|uniref:Peroxidase n=2 Tax=Ceratodon purpureus TaxID=3225 RepID=A0A8T0I8L6_CERPU|nr:hypothetical protein KC19_4G144200 [Ceratodon purpureus]KAG0580060.1 hypothetical protein KC19_4G144200 [Ceratodon purpureus]